MLARVLREQLVVPATGLHCDDQHGGQRVLRCDRTPRVGGGARANHAGRRGSVLAQLAAKALGGTTEALKPRSFLLLVAIFPHAGCSLSWHFPSSGLILREVCRHV